VRLAGVKSRTSCVIGLRAAHARAPPRHCYCCYCCCCCSCCCSCDDGVANSRHNQKRMTRDMHPPCLHNTLMSCLHPLSVCVCVCMCVTSLLLARRLAIFPCTRRGDGESCAHLLLHHREGGPKGSSFSRKAAQQHSQPPLSGSERVSEKNDKAQARVAPWQKAFFVVPPLCGPHSTPPLVNMSRRVVRRQAKIMLEMPCLPNALRAVALPV